MDITVIDSGNEDIAGRIAAGCAAAGLKADDVRIRHVASAANVTGPPPDLIVVSPDAAAGKRGEAVPTACGILLLPGDGDAEDFDAGCVVTYGLSPKDTLTLSSIGEEICVAALQRELLTVSGDMLERQEFMIKTTLRPDSLLA